MPHASVPLLVLFLGLEFPFLVYLLDDSTHIELLLWPGPGAVRVNKSNSLISTSLQSGEI